MKKSIGKILLSLTVCLLIGNASGSASEPVRLFVKEVPLKILGKTVTVIAIEQADARRDIRQRRPTDFTWKW